MDDLSGSFWDQSADPRPPGPDYSGACFGQTHVLETNPTQFAMPRLPADVGTSCRLWLFHAGWRAEFCRLKCCVVLLIQLSQKLIQSRLPLFCFLVFVPTGAQPQRVCYQLRSVIAITLETNMTHYHLSESPVCRRCFQCTKLNLIQSCRVCDE